MSNLTRALMMGAAGASADKIYVDDVFSTYLFDGTGSAQTITTGIDLAGEGGLVWIKRRDSPAANHVLFDTVRGVDKALFSDDPLGSSDFANSLTAFSSSGFSLGSNSTGNASGLSNVSWSFRKAPGFFDVVSYTGNGTAGRSIAHNLGSVPGSIWVKNLTDSENWVCYHRGLAGTHKNAHERFIQLNNNSAAYPSDSSVSTAAGTWGGTAPNADNFYLGSSVNENASGKNYIAYVFAHDDQSFGTNNDEAIIKCGSYTGNGSDDGPEINLGFEAQWVMTKAVSQTRNWIIGDVMRGAPVSSGAQDAANLSANVTDAEILSDEPFVPTSTGFKVRSNSGTINDNGLIYIYMAIRRPNKPPEAATEVFDDVIYNGTAGVQNIVNSMLYTDLTWIKRRTSTDPPVITDRLRGDTKYFKTNLSDAASTWASNDLIKLDKMYSFGLAGNATGYINSGSQPYISWNFKRAPGFFDVVAYSGTGSAKTVDHNLSAIPELIICKRRDSTSDWPVYYGNQMRALRLNTTGSYSNSSVWWNNTAPTSTVFSLNTNSENNASGGSFIAYLFATLPGISKVGSYSGSNSAQNIDCGFTNGARFVLIKRNDGTADWFVYDTARGISSGNDPYLKINQAEVEVTNTDYIEPLNAGFIVNGNVGDINTSGGTYIFLAIA